MLEMFESYDWAYSALMNIVLALACVGLAVSLTKGAGFQCRAALVRLFQRFGFLFLAATLMNCALRTIQLHHAPPLYAMLAQIGFMWVLATSAIRHFWSPPIPKDASWDNPMHMVSFTDRSRVR